MKILLGNPLLPLLLWSAAFLWVWALRKSTIITLSATAAVLLLLFLLLPGGQEVAESTKTLPSVSGRADCVADSLRGGVWWGGELPGSCAYRGSSLLP